MESRRHCPHCRGQLEAAPLLFSRADVCRGCLVIVPRSHPADTAADVSALGGDDTATAITYAIESRRAA